MHVARATFEGNPFVGIFAKTSDCLTLLPKAATERFKRACSEALKTKIITASIANSDLLGMFSAMNSNGIVTSSMAYESEVGSLREAGLNLAVISERRTALGNNILVNDYACMINPALSEESAKCIGDCLGVEVVRGTIGGYKTVGFAAVATNRGILARTNITDEELSFLEELFKVKGAVGTANMGVSFVGLCMLANSNGVVVGEMTSGFELNRIDEALGFIGR
jgi:translation initiation factor 6